MWTRPSSNKAKEESWGRPDRFALAEERSSVGRTHRLSFVNEWPPIEEPEEADLKETPFEYRDREIDDEDPDQDEDLHQDQQDEEHEQHEHLQDDEVEIEEAA